MWAKAHSGCRGPMAKKQVTESESGDGGWTLKRLPPMDEKEFLHWQELIEQRTGITVSRERLTHLQTSIGLRMREVGCESYEAYYRQIVGNPGGIAEWAILVDRITVQETRFFRDPDALELVSNFIRTLPQEMLARGTLEAWSVGCSTGEETYSLAIVIREALAQRDTRIFYGVTGTDISKAALNMARKGLYPERKLRTLDKAFIEHYFEYQEREGAYQILVDIRERTCFARVNVLNLGDAPMHGMSIIFCQNLLIYFRKWRRKEILDNLAERLVPGGLMVLGMGEMTGWNNPLLERLPSERCLAFVRRPA
jgi:type IV pilus assembly protein PilK